MEGGEGGGEARVNELFYKGSKSEKKTFFFFFFFVFEGGGGEVAGEGACVSELF